MATCEASDSTGVSDASQVALTLKQVDADGDGSVSVAEVLRLANDFDHMHKFVLFQGLTYVLVGLVFTFGYTIFESILATTFNAGQRDVYRGVGLGVIYIGSVYIASSQYAPYVDFAIRQVLGDPAKHISVRLEPTESFAIATVIARVCVIPVLCPVWAFAVCETVPAQFLCLLFLVADVGFGVLTLLAMRKVKGREDDAASFGDGDGDGKISAAELLALANDFGPIHKWNVVQGGAYLGVGALLAFAPPLWEAILSRAFSPEGRDFYRCIGVVVMYIGFLYVASAQWRPMVQAMVRGLLGEPARFVLLRLEPTDSFALVSIVGRAGVIPVLVLVLVLALLDTWPAKVLGYVLLVADSSVSLLTLLLLRRKYGVGRKSKAVVPSA